MLEASMSTSTRASAMFSSIVSMVPVTAPKAPFTLETIMWRTENSTLECAGSMAQIVLAGASARVVTSLLRSRDIDGPADLYKQYRTKRFICQLLSEGRQPAPDSVE